MKYIEELEVGDTFLSGQDNYIVTSDYRKNGSRSCVNLKTGFGKWMEANAVVDICPIYTLDQDNNIVAVKVTEKENAN